MTDAPDLSRAAALIAEPTRAHMLLALMSGAALTAGELARGANVSPQAASNHLAALLGGGLVEVAAQGRHRYYRLRGPEVALALEALLNLPTSAQTQNRVGPRVPPELRFARRCYDHLAGELGVLVLDALLRREWLLEGEGGLSVTPAGRLELIELGVNEAALHAGRRPAARPCLDWSERRPHLGGPLGAAVLTAFTARGGVAAVQGRELRLTVPGTVALEALGVRLGAASRAS